MAVMTELCVLSQGRRVQGTLLEVDYYYEKQAETM